MAHDVFISHASPDRDVAEAACFALEQRGLTCWIAPRDILPGQNYGEAIVEAIRGCRVFLLVFSAAANESPQVRREVERAGSRGVALIPFRIEPVEPSDALAFFISAAHWLDALTPPIATHLDYLGDTVAQLLEGPPARPRETSRPPGPLPRRRRRVPGWAPVAAAGALGLVAIALAAAYVARPAAPAPARPGLVPDVSRTIFTRRAVPLPSDKPLRLRAGPAADAAQIAVIGTDEVFRVAPRQGDWWPARLTSGAEGYVMARWVRVVDEGRP